MRVPRPTPRPAPRAVRANATRGSGGRATNAQRVAQTRQAVRAIQTARARSTATDNRILTALSTERNSHRRAGAAGSTLHAVRSRGYLPVAAFITLLGGFVTTAGAGSGNGFVSAIGLGIAISGLVYALFTLGQRRIASMAPGTAHIVSATAPPAASTHGRCEMHLVVQAPRLSATAVRHRDQSVPVAKWPTPGGTLPVVVDPRDPRDLRIRWDKVRPHGEASAQRPAPRAETAGQPNDGIGVLADGAQISRTTPERPALASGPVHPAPPVETPPAATVGTSGSATVAPPGSATTQSPAVDGMLEATGGEPVDLGFLPDLPEGFGEPPRLGSLLESDPLLVEYGSPIREIGVTLIVSDLKQSLEFYRDVLGCFEIESGPDMVLLEARTGRLVLQQRDDAEPKPPRLMHLTLEVNDIDSAYRTLAKRGVEFLDEPRTVLRGELLELWAVSFHDPDGHGLALTCWQPREEDG